MDAIRIVAVAVAVLLGALLVIRRRRRPSE